MKKIDNFEILDLKEFLNVHEATAFLGVSRSFMYKKIDQGLPVYGLGKKSYFKKSDLEALFKYKGKEL